MINIILCVSLCAHVCVCVSLYVFCDLACIPETDQLPNCYLSLFQLASKQAIEVLGSHIILTVSSKLWLSTGTGGLAGAGLRVDRYQAVPTAMAASPAMVAGSDRNPTKAALVLVVSDIFSLVPGVSSTRMRCRGFFSCLKLDQQKTKMAEAEAEVEEHKLGSRASSSSYDTDGSGYQSFDDTSISVHPSGRQLVTGDSSNSSPADPSNQQAFSSSNSELESKLMSLQQENSRLTGENEELKQEVERRKRKSLTDNTAKRLDTSLQVLGLYYSLCTLASAC